MFPEFAFNRFPRENEIEKQLNVCKQELRTILDHNKDCVKSGISGLENTFFKALPATRKLLIQDVDAIYKGDPAAKSKAEVIRTYPGFYAIAAHRIAHELLKNGVNLIPRIISEHA